MTWTPELIKATVDAIGPYVVTIVLGIYLHKRTNDVATAADDAGRAARTAQGTADEANRSANGMMVDLASMVAPDAHAAAVGAAVKAVLDSNKPTVTVDLGKTRELTRKDGALTETG